MAKPTGKQYAEEANALLSKPTIPYVDNGSSLKGMDCQGLIEYCLKQLGISVNMKGSNEMYRKMCTWVGTPEECKKKYGKIPQGAQLFIHAFDGGEVARGYHDDLGNASHTGIYTGIGDGAVHASFSRKKVAASVFKGKTIRNGGWNKVGLSKYIDYGLDKSQVEEVEVKVMEQKMWVAAISGQTVRMRVEPSKNADVLYAVPVGSEVTAIGTSGSWTQIIYKEWTGWMMSEFLRTENPYTGQQGESKSYTISLDMSTAKALKAAQERAGV